MRWGQVGTALGLDELECSSKVPYVVLGLLREFPCACLCGVVSVGKRGEGGESHHHLT